MVLDIGNNFYLLNLSSLITCLFDNEWILYSREKLHVVTSGSQSQRVKSTVCFTIQVNNSYSPSTPHPPPPLVFIVEIPWSLNYLWSIFHFRPIAIFFLFLFFFGIFFFFQLSFCFILGCDNLAQCQDSCGNYAAYLSFILVSNTEFHQPITPQHQYEFSPNYTFPLVPTWRIHLTIKAS